ncbi:hypothetical protein FACS1894199_09610 [Bacteroidia bacterium]|nr:hypothetical protein FACS1894199_09610 [Bacteroidia bacterium]
MGVHNTLEAAVYGIPIIFGPKYQKFNEACTLIERKGGFSITNKEPLKDLLDTFLHDQAARKLAGKKAVEYVNSQLGATDIIVHQIIH